MNTYRIMIFLGHDFAGYAADKSGILEFNNEVETNLYADDMHRGSSIGSWFKIESSKSFKMNSHFEIITEATKESPDVVKNALKSIYKRTATQELDSLASQWEFFTVEEKQDICNLYAGTYQTTHFLALMEGLSQSSK